MEITEAEFLEIAKALISKWSELTCEEIDKDIIAIQEGDTINSVYIRAYWEKFINTLLYSDYFIKKSDNVEDRLSLIHEIFYDQLDFPSKEMKIDVKNRFEWLKKRVVKDYESNVKKTIDLNRVVSPIEQIFIMEWKFSNIEDKLHLRLKPQTPIETDKGVFKIDFIVIDENGGDNKFIIAIELDGHDFHEKTKLQVEKDKKRERAIVRKGIYVLRFSGSEIIKDARGCIKEITGYLEKEYADKT